jgi:hypothetical protein
LVACSTSILFYEPQTEITKVVTSVVRVFDAEVVCLCILREVEPTAPTVVTPSPCDGAWWFFYKIFNDA